MIEKNPEISDELNKLSNLVVGAAIKVHRKLGSGLLCMNLL